MYRLVLSDRFKRSLREFVRKHPELQRVAQERFEILRHNPRDARMKTHKLTGKLKGLLAASITREYRVVFYVEKNLIFLLAIGGHEEVY